MTQTDPRVEAVAKAICDADGTCASWAAYVNTYGIDSYACKRSVVPTGEHTMRYLVTAFPRRPLSQQVFAADGDAAIDMALANPNRWSVPTPSDDKVEWSYYAVPVDEPMTVPQDNTP